MLFRTLLENPLAFIIVAGALIISISIHEFAHAYVSNRLGDSTAKMLGRVTLNPLSHLDPIGTLLLLFAGFGWGKPVPFNPYNLENPKRDSALIAFAGPLSNFILAILFALLVFGISVLPVPTSVYIASRSVFEVVVFYNLVLGLFNLIPIHPLDGFKVVNAFLPEDLSYQWLQLAPYGIYLLLLLILTNGFSLILSTPLNVGMNLLGF